MIRRQRLGDLKKVVRWRYGHPVPDDDAGREDLRELLLPISLGPEAGRKMENAIEVWAPWMNAVEAGQLMDEINRTPSYLRKPTGHASLCLPFSAALFPWDSQAVEVALVCPDY
jgi:hypothetical protein